MSRGVAVPLASVPVCILWGSSGRRRRTVAARVTELWRETFRSKKGSGTNSQRIMVMVMVMDNMTETPQGAPVNYENISEVEVDIH
jgi:hypothetical protein